MRNKVLQELSDEINKHNVKCFLEFLFYKKGVDVIDEIKNIDELYKEYLKFIK